MIRLYSIQAYNPLYPSLEALKLQPDPQPKRLSPGKDSTIKPQDNINAAQLLSSKATNPIRDKLRSNPRNCEELAVEIAGFAVDRRNDDKKDNPMYRSAGWAKRSTTQSRIRYSHSFPSLGSIRALNTPSDHEPSLALLQVQGVSS